MFSAMAGDPTADLSIDFDALLTHLIVQDELPEAENIYLVGVLVGAALLAHLERPHVKGRPS